MELQNYNKKYQSRNHLVYSCQYHVIFCPKYRRKVLTDGIDERLKQLITETQEEYGYEVLDMEVMPDHVHLLLDVDPKVGIYSVVTKIKGYTSKQLREQFPALKKRIPTLWTRSKFISSVGSVSLDVVKRYIEEQKHV
ncbi:IS200/IS605 family transposase [Methanohalophilus profundi]|uniref:IS200/IS605 family transposase n=1 Tax=Methanohalophilus profundi TaxID=2138083 RepID=UPI00101C2827|nr:IS200/IS605 family transposase [Methanohalophilus profundi]